MVIMSNPIRSSCLLKQFFKGTLTEIHQLFRSFAVLSSFLPVCREEFCVSSYAVISAYAVPKILYDYEYNSKIWDWIQIKILLEGWKVEIITLCIREKKFQEFAELKPHWNDSKFILFYPPRNLSSGLMLIGAIFWHQYWNVNSININ